MVTQISPGAVAERIWELYRREAGILIPTAVVLYAVEFVIALILPGRLGPILGVLFWVLVILYQGFVVELVRTVESHRSVGRLRTLVDAVAPALGSLLIISILFVLGVAIGLILIIVPGLILLTMWSVVVPVEVLERRGVFGSFARSRELVRGNAWNVFGVIVIVWLVALGVSLLAAAIAAPLGHVGRDLVQWAVNVVLAPVVALSASVVYYELLRVRGEPEPA